MTSAIRQLAPLPAAPAAGYWNRARRPLASLAFVLPIILLYEVGALLLGPTAARGGADQWLRQFLRGVGLGGDWLLPCLTAAILLAWHHTTRQRWRVRAVTLGGMAVESTGMALLLVAVAHLPEICMAGVADHDALQVASRGPPSAPPFAPRVVGLLGAGIYEEVLFRLMLLPSIVLAAGLAVAAPGARTVLAVLASSLLFAMAHHAGAHGDPFAWFPFTFRMLAGTFFSILFLTRGFGITVGSHTLYDILVGIP